MGIIETLHNSTDFNNLIYHYKGPTPNAHLNNFIDAGTIFNVLKFKRKNSLMQKKAKQNLNQN